MHKQLEHYLQCGKKSTIDKFLQRLGSVGTNSLSHDSYAHKAAVLIQQNEFTKKMREDTSLLYFTADLEEFMHCVERKEGLNDYFSRLSTSRYTYDNTFQFYEEMMIENILYLMDERKFIFFQMGVPDYMTSETPQKRVYDAHAEGDGAIGHGHVVVRVEQGNRLCASRVIHASLARPRARHIPVSALA